VSLSRLERWCVVVVVVVVVVSKAVAGVGAWWCCSCCLSLVCRVLHPIYRPANKDILGAKPPLTSTWKHSRTGQQVLIQDKHGLFADLANKELSDSSKKFRYGSKPYEDVKFKLSIQSDTTLILASSYKI
jgi:hypothetical protein